MYVILVNDDNTLTTTHRQRVMQKSKLVDTLCFMAYPIYKSVDLTDFTVVMEYTLPVSREYCSEILVLSDERYRGYLQYKLPFDTTLTNEPGEIEVKLTFSKVDLDEYGNDIQRVRKTDTEKIIICPTTTWIDIVPDSALSALDQRILQTDAQIRALQEMGDIFDKTKADNIVYNKDTNELQLVSGSNPIGDVVEMETVQIDDEMIEEAVDAAVGEAVEGAFDEALSAGIPVVEF